jgi:aspartate racemase
MRRIGVIGGMSWYSTAEYYRVINERVQERLGGHHSADLLVHSLDFAEIRQCQIDGDWERAGKIMATSAAGLVGAGAQLVVLATNLMHKAAGAIEDAIEVPFLHIADAVGAEAARLGARQLGLLGTSPVLEEQFYAERLARHGVETVVPDAPTRTRLDAIIFGELTVGDVRPQSRSELREALRTLADAGAEAVALACTELELAVTAEDSPVPLIATAGGGNIGVIAAAVAFGYLVTVWYEGAMTASTGQTVGKKAAGLRVVRADDPTQPPSHRAAIIRASVPLGTGILFAPLGPLSAMAGWLAPYLMALTAPDRRGLHDRLSGTMVVPAVVT